MAELIFTKDIKPKFDKKTESEEKQEEKQHMLEDEKDYQILMAYDSQSPIVFCNTAR